jgi:hypothetical protein
MIIWSGKGFFSIMFLMLSIAITQTCMESFTGQKPSQLDDNLMWALSFTLAAAANFVFARYLSKRPKQIVIDKATGREFELSEQGSLFFIPTRWWTHIFAGVAVICYIVLLTDRH